MSCAPQVVVTLVNRASAILFFIACSRILPLIGFAAHAKAHDYEPGPHAEPARTALVTSLPVFAWDMSHLARDWWLLVLQFAVLIVTLFVNISYERVYAVYLAYQLQVVVMSGMLAASFLLAARPHLRLLGAAIGRAANRATCGICCGRNGVCTAVCAALRGGSSGSGGGGGGGGGDMSRNASTNSDARAAELHDYFQYGSDEDSGEETDATSTAGGGGAGSAAAHEKRRSLRMQRMSSKDGLEAPPGSSGSGATPSAVAGALASAAAGGPAKLSTPAVASAERAVALTVAARGQGGQPVKLSVSGLVSGTVQPLTGPYVALAAWCLLMGALQLAKAALFLYTPITRGGKISGLASEVLYPWFFYILPEAVPALAVLHLLLRGGLFACEGWKCRPRLHRCCRPCTPKKRSGSTAAKDEKSPLVASTAGPSAAAVAGAAAGGVVAAAAPGKGGSGSGKGVTLIGETVEALPEGTLAAAAAASGAASDGEDVESCSACLYGWVCAFWWGCCSSNPDDDGTDF